MKHELSKEQLKPAIELMKAFIAEEASAHGTSTYAIAAQVLIDALLAAHEQEPVAWRIHTPLTNVTYVELNAEAVERVRVGCAKENIEVEITPLAPLCAHPAPSIPSVADDYLLAALENHETFWAMREMELGSLSPEATMVRDVGLRAIAKAKAAPSTPAAVTSFHHDPGCDLFKPRVMGDVFIPRSCDCRAASTIPAAVPEVVMQAILKVARIRCDFNEFDGDRRGIADCLDEAEQELILAINSTAAMLKGGKS